MSSSIGYHNHHIIGQFQYNIYYLKKHSHVSDIIVMSVVQSLSNALSDSSENRPNISAHGSVLEGIRDDGLDVTTGHGTTSDGVDDETKAGYDTTWPATQVLLGLVESGLGGQDDGVSGGCQGGRKHIVPSWKGDECSGQIVPPSMVYQKHTMKASVMTKTERACLLSYNATSWIVGEMFTTKTEKTMSSGLFHYIILPFHHSQKRCCQRTIRSGRLLTELLRWK